MPDHTPARDIRLPDGRSVGRFTPVNGSRRGRDEDLVGKRSSTAQGGGASEQPGKRTLTQELAPTPTVDDVATYAVEHKDAGKPLPTTVQATMEGHLGMALGDVRVHDDPQSAASNKLMGARAFAHGKDIYLGANERAEDLSLMGHELTHVAQQAGAGAAPMRKVTVGAAGSPLEQQADAVAAGVVAGEKPPMLVDADAPVQPGQMHVAAFLQQLRVQVEQAAAAHFGPLWRAAGCHYIDKYFGYYEGRSARDLVRALKLYAPEGAASGNAQVALGAVVARVANGMATWQATGELPADAARIAPPQAHEDAAAATADRPEAAQAMHQCTAACKHAPGEHPTGDPFSALGEGQPLATDVANRMSDALGADVSAARIHTGGDAAQLAASHDAKALAVGRNIAFGSGAYQPGTPAGDALLAHELAHTVQQKDADPRGPIGGESAAAETNANEQAAAAMAQLHGGMSKDAAAAMAISQVMATGLQLQRCSEGNTPAVAPPSATGATKDLFAGSKAPDETQQQAIDKILNPTGAGGAASKPYKRTGFKGNMIKALDGWRKATTAHFKPLSGPDAFKLDMPQVRKTGDAAQAVVTAKYGDYIKAGTATGSGHGTAQPGYKVSDPSVLHTQEESIDPLPKSDQEDMVAGLVSYAMQQPDGGKAVAEAHNVDLSRTPDKTDYYTVMNDYAKKHFAELKKIQRDWPGEEHPWDGTVYVQTRRVKNAALEAKDKGGDAKFKDANLRRGYWSTFQTLIHEYLHAAAHAGWRDIHDAPNTSGSKHHIMVEGACEYFTERAYKDIEPKIATDDALREQVEGKKYPFTPEVVPPWHGYDSRADVEAWVAAMGGNENNLRLAYFMGHTELVGLGPWKKEMAGEAGNYEVLVDGLSLATISERTFVSVADIQKANKFPSTKDTVDKGKIVVPGISYHRAVAGDTETTIAEQHGITVDALKKANPFVTNWKLVKGQTVMIPAH